jgi:hypothetical protein
MNTSISGNKTFAHKYEEKGGDMNQELEALDAKIAVYDWAKGEGAIAANLVTSAIGNRQDAFVCLALVESRYRPPVMPTIFLVFKGDEGDINIIRLMSWRGLILINAFEKNGYFIFRVAGIGVIGGGILKIRLSDIDLKPQKAGN